MPLQIEYAYRTHGIGQGLFSSAQLHDETREVRFAWVYDCGTSSSDRLLAEAVSELEGRLAKRPRIDLLTLSHFDADHISGICRLIERFRIGILMLPYMPLSRRLVLAFEEGLTYADDLIRFFTNPVAYLIGIDGPGIETILFVPPSGGEGPPFDSPNDPRGEPSWGDEPPVLRYDFDKSENEERGILSHSQGAQARGTRIAFLKPGGAIKLSSLWEFVPYNDDLEEPISSKFETRVNAALARLLALAETAQQKRQRSVALSDLKQLYDDEFGDNSEARNVISLFLYSGPVYATWRQFCLWGAYTMPARHPVVRRWPLWCSEADDLPCSWLCTGDGYLDTSDRLHRLIDFLDQARIKRLALLQVMHHGAARNWHRGVAAQLAPVYSVFSSDPNWKGWWHPHAEVLRDFWPYSPIQVDKTHGALVRGRVA